MRHLTILMYHSLDSSGSAISLRPKIFARQMSTLAAIGYRGVSLRQAMSHKVTHDDWPERSVVITFDDGYANLHEFALPELSRHGFGATVFLVTDYMGRRAEWVTPGMKDDDLKILTWNQARELANAGFEMAAHTLTHPDLTRIPSTQLEHEITASREAVQMNLNSDVDSFAYPYGRFDQRACTAVRRCFRGACTTELRRARDNDALRLPRIDMYYFREATDIDRLVMGKSDRYLAYRRWGRRVRGMLDR